MGYKSDSAWKRSHLNRETVPAQLGLPPSPPPEAHLGLRMPHIYFWACSNRRGPQNSHLGPKTAIFGLLMAKIIFYKGGQLQNKMGELLQKVGKLFFGGGQVRSQDVQKRFSRPVALCLGLKTVRFEPKMDIFGHFVGSNLNTMVYWLPSPY